MINNNVNQLKDFFPSILAEEVIRLEDLVPLILTEKHTIALGKLRQYPEKYNEVRDRARRYLESATTLKLLPKLNMDPENFTDEDVQRLKYGIALQKGYIKENE